MRHDINEPDTDQAAVQAFAAATIAAANRGAAGTSSGDQTDLQSPTGIEIRVLKGHQAGARQAWDGQSLTVQTETGMGAGNGEDPDAFADIVLFDTVKPPVRLRVHGPVLAARIELLSGRAKLGELSLASGQSAAWHPYQALVLGSSVLAFGEKSKSDWSHEPASLASTDETNQMLSDTGESDDAHPALLQRIGVWPLAAGMVVAAISAVAFGVIKPSISPAASTASLDQKTFASALSESPFAHLRTKTLPDGKQELSGRLGTLAQKRQLDAWLSQQDDSVRQEIDVDEALVRDVAEVYRLNGVTVQASSRGPGAVLAEVKEPNKQKFEAASEAVRRDVRGLHELITRNTAKPAPPKMPKVPDDPNKRIVSLVPGALGYLITADGSRYFIGAMLPTGYRVTRIRSTSVLLERDGHQMRLRL